METCPQAIRRGRLTEWARQGFNAYKIMKLAGHSKIETAQWYVNLAESEVVDACNALAEDPIQVPA